MKPARVGLTLLFCLACAGCGGDMHGRSDDAEAALTARAEAIVSTMSLRQKLGEKIMMAFRYWCAEDTTLCKSGMTEMPPAIASVVRDNHIGGVILFSDNLTSIEQTHRLLAALRSARTPGATTGLLLGTDQEGGNVFRLPRVQATSFPGNMALGAAYQASGDARLAYRQGKVMGDELRAVGFNVAFAPVVDVNSNPLNPVINVRAYGDDPDDIAVLAQETLNGLRKAGVVGTLKHFPGHGDTSTDSHFGLPLVEKTREQAEAIDLAPYRRAIVQSGPSDRGPEMIMTAHIQYPALDDTRVTLRTGERIVTPATMSRRIQHDLLRTQMGFDGVTVTDALDMAGISHFFDEEDAVLKVFQADVDIALMPVAVSTEQQVGRVPRLVDFLVDAVQRGALDRAELDRSVVRITRMKLRNGIDATAKPGAAGLGEIGGAPHRAVENEIARQSITLLRNVDDRLPLRDRAARILIVTPWGEQAAGVARRLQALGFASVQHAKLGTLSIAALRQRIEAADVLIAGTTALAATPVADPIRAGASLATAQAAGAPPTPRDAMVYAMQAGKTVVHVTMRAPYDVLDYEDVSHASLATYAYFGYEDGWRGPSMAALADVLAGASQPAGRLPVVIAPQTGPVRYPRGFGMRYPQSRRRSPADA
ncbi:glycoside hydrolase family 3 protein [Chitinasiproducens palmae]|nr:glycoside hydrolase family 3 protein [Chitinasiproducens palmae]